ncbi:hypothetical protein AARAC_004780 [Aspergillus arachidicola]|uniref:SH3 domain-containing protein n=1 Tax=Aspergillus arachidicola TaxID=656916 RepID=A0A2G7FJ48_9EURO|nr:hypothetical protein AARAC_004780 [Aspergillus arachidicola]
MQSIDGFLPLEQPSGIETTGGSANQFNQGSPGITERQSNATLNSPYQKDLGPQETKKWTTDNGVSSSGSQGTNGWSQNSGQSQAGSGAWGTAGTASVGQWAQGTTSGSTGSNAGAAAPDNGLYHPEQSNTNGQGTQLWTPGDGLYHPSEWSPTSTTKLTSTSSIPNSPATQSSPPLSSPSITSKPTATSNPSNSTTTSMNEATKLAIPISLGVASAAMAAIILWWLYRKVKDAKAEKKRINTLEEGDYIQDPRPSSFRRSLATLCDYCLFKSATKPTPVAARSSLSVCESPCKQCDGYSGVSETSSLDETSSRDIEKLQPPEYAASAEMLVPEGHRRADISMPYKTQRAETCARPRTVTPTSLPGVPEEPEESEEAGEFSPPITQVDSKGAVEEVYMVELSFNPISAKHVELKQGQTAKILKKYGDGWALCYLPESKAEGLAPRAYLSATPVKRPVSNSSNLMQHPQYNVSQFSFSSQSTNLGLDGAQPPSR